MIRVGALTSIVLLGFACTPRKGQPGQHAQPQAVEDSVEKVAPPRPTPPVSAETVREVTLLMDKIQSESPDAPRPELAQAPDETSAAFEDRIRQQKRAESRSGGRFKTQWRYFYVASLNGGDVPAAHTEASKFIRQHRKELSLKWECSVFDVRRYSYGHEVYCSVKSIDDWDYSVLVASGAGKLKKGDLIRFENLGIGMPAEHEDLKLRLTSGPRESDDGYTATGYVKFAVLTPR